MKKSTKKLARHLTALFAALAVGLGTLPAAAFAADAPEPIPEQPAIVGVESAQEEGQSDAVGTDAVGTDTVGTDETGTDTVGTDETGTGETGTDETGTDETETDETGTDETGTDETETGGTGTDETGTDETTPSEDAVLPTEPATQPEQPEETPAAGEAPATEEIPAEVKAFLDAAANLPDASEVTAENAEEIGEQVNAAFDAYEALVAAGLDEADGVAVALETVYAVYAAVAEAQHTEHDTFAAGTVGKTSIAHDFQQFPWTNDFSYDGYNYYCSSTKGEVTINDADGVYDAGTPNINPRGGWVQPNADSYYNPIVRGANDIVDVKVSWQGSQLRIDFKPGTKTGKTTVKVDISFKYTTMGAFEGTTADGNLYFWYDVVNNVGDAVEKPEAPNKNNTVISYVYIQCKETPSYIANSHHAPAMLFYDNETTIFPGEVIENSGAIYSSSDYPYQCTVELNGDFYVNLWNKNLSTKLGSHKLYRTPKTITFYYRAQDGKWTCPTSSLIKFNSSSTGTAYGWLLQITKGVPQPSTYTVIYTDGVVGEIVFANQVHEGKKAGDKTPSFEMADSGTITLNDGTVQPSRDGYTFQGWSPAVNPVVSADDADTNGVITYMATWQKNTSINDLTITKTADKDKAEIGETIKYTIKVENNSNTSATVKVVDKLPEKVDFVKVSDSDGGVYDKTTHTVTWENVTVPAHGSKQLLVWVKANTSGTIENKATVTLDGQDKESDPAIVEVPKPDPGEAEYAVQWIDAANNTVLKSENHTGTVGTTVTVNENDKAYPGYTYVGDEDARNVLSATLEESGTVLKLYFTKDTENPGPGPDEPGKDQYNVTYKWTGLPENHNETLPEGGKYEKGAEVTVDTNYYANKEVVIGEKTYVFSGWNTSDADIENGKFTMPNKDVTLIGTWTEKAENPGPGPDEPGKDQYNVTYKWTGLPENHNETLPEGGKYEEGETVTVDTSFVKGQEVIVGGKTYVFSGWDQTGSFAMPAEDVTINGSWSEKPVTPTPGPDPVDPTPGEPDDPTPPSGGYVPRPRPVTPPVVDVPEIDVPLVETPVVEFVEPEVPLTEAPELPEAEVPEEDVPLADIPKTGDSGLSLWAMLAAFSLAGILALGRKLRTK